MSAAIRSIFADVFNILFRQKRYAASATLTTRSYFHTFFRIIFFREVNRRGKLNEANKAESLFEVPEKQGFLKVGNLIDSKLKSEVISASKELLSQKLNPEYIKKFENAPFVSIQVDSGLTPENPFLKFALQKNLVKSLTNYFGILPVIENISIWYSPNNKNLEGSSQLYHLDGQDVKTVQLFLFIEDVNNDNGPLVVLEAEKSIEIANKIKYRKTKLLKRVDDDFVKSQTTPNQIIQATGAAGECYIVDTDRCFHFGSRQGTKPRYVVVFQYYTPFAFVLPWRWWTKLPFAGAAESGGFSAIDRAVMGSKN